jgi:transcriptional regulator
MARPQHEIPCSRGVPTLRLLVRTTSIHVDRQHESAYLHVAVQQEPPLADKTDVLHGALDLMVLRALDTLGPQHGYGIARRIEQMSEHALALNQGTLYPALLRLEQQGWLVSKWGVSENNRRARFYSLSPRGKRHLHAEAARWSHISSVLSRFLSPTEDLP